jgi:hypothetical protein
MRGFANQMKPDCASPHPGLAACDAWRRKFVPELLPRHASVQGLSQDGAVHMIRRAFMTAARAVGGLATSALLLTTPASAIVGDAETVAGKIARHVVVVANARGLCTGTVLAHDLILTAAHCLQSGRAHWVVSHRSKRHMVAEFRQHPEFVRSKTSAARQEADLAVVKLTERLPPDALPAFLGRVPMGRAEAIMIAGFGIADQALNKVSGPARMAVLSPFGLRGQLIMLKDPRSDGGAPLGACRGDSGAPAFAIRDGLVVVGVVIGAPRECGGWTTVMPISRQYDWIAETARSLGSPVTP